MARYAAAAVCRPCTDCSVNISGNEHRKYGIIVGSMAGMKRPNGSETASYTSAVLTRQKGCRHTLRLRGADREFEARGIVNKKTSVNAYLISDNSADFALHPSRNGKRNMQFHISILWNWSSSISMNGYERPPGLQHRTMHPRWLQRRSM